MSSVLFLVLIHTLPGLTAAPEDAPEAAPVMAAPVEVATNPNVVNPNAESKGGNPAPDDNDINAGASADENSNDTG